MPLKQRLNRAPRIDVRGISQMEILDGRHQRRMSHVLLNDFQADTGF